MNFIRAFLIGSSYPVFISFFIIVLLINTKIRNYSFSVYSLVAPLYFGLMNVIAIYLKNNFGLSLEKVYLVLSLISFIIVSNIAVIFKMYNFTKDQWIIYFLFLFIHHYITYNIIIYNLMKI